MTNSTPRQRNPKGIRILPALVVFLAMVGCQSFFRRSDDALEPNDNVRTPTRLALNHALEGRVNEGNPDVFEVSVPSPGLLTFSLESRGLENCPSFRVVGPQPSMLLYEDRNYACRKTAEPPFKKAGVILRRIGNSGYELTVPTQNAGRYWLTLQELGQPDNALPFSWDYRIAATHTETNTSQVPDEASGPH